MPGSLTISSCSARSTSSPFFCDEALWFSIPSEQLRLTIGSRKSRVAILAIAKNIGLLFSRPTESTIRSLEKLCREQPTPLFLMNGSSQGFGPLSLVRLLRSELTPPSGQSPTGTLWSRGPLFAIGRLRRRCLRMSTLDLDSDAQLRRFLSSFGYFPRCEVRFRLSTNRRWHLKIWSFDFKNKYFRSRYDDSWRFFLDQHKPLFETETLFPLKLEGGRTSVVTPMTPGPSLPGRGERVGTRKIAPQAGVESGDDPLVKRSGVDRPVTLVPLRESRLMFRSARLLAGARSEARTSQGA